MTSSSTKTLEFYSCGQRSRGEVAYEEYSCEEEDWEGKGILIDKLQYWPEPENIVDLATKGIATSKEFKLGSRW